MSNTAVGSPYDWTRFSVRMYYRSDIELVWAAWATPYGLESFFIETCAATAADGRPLGARDVFEQGTRFRWTWRHDLGLDGVFTHVEPGRRLDFTFGDMTVRVELEATAAGTSVLLSQSGIPATEEGHVWGHLNCRSCWVFFMTNLTSVLDSGCDLRHTDPHLVSSMEIGFEPPR